MAFTITSRTTIINPTQTFDGTVTAGSPQLIATINGKSYSVAMNSPSAGNWMFSIPSADALQVDGSYVLSVTDGSTTKTMTTNFAGPLDFDKDTPAFTIPDPMPVITVTAAAAEASAQEFMGMTADASSSCDLFGTVQGLASELTRTVKDAAGEVIGVIKESTATIVASIKNTIGEAFGGSGSFLNTLKGYVNDAVSWATDMKTAMMDSAAEAVQWARDLIASGQSFAYEAIVAAKAQIASVTSSVNSFIGSLQSKFAGVMDTITAGTNALKGFMSDIRSQLAAIPNIVGEAVKGIAVASCNTLNTVLAGSPADAFANITNGATDAATKAFGAAKEAFNNGAENIAEVYSSIVDSTGIGDVFDAVKSGTSSLVSSISSTASSITTSAMSMKDDLYASFANKPIMP